MRSATETSPSRPSLSSRPVWSRQHGATILLSVSWLVATASTRHLSLAQPALLVALLSGFHVVEIGLSALRRGGLANARQRLWLGLYLILATTATLVAFTLAPALLARLPLAAGALLAAVVVERFGATKRGMGELVLFGGLAAAGMLAYRPAASLSDILPDALPLWLVAWWYFALSISLVKYRLGRVSGRAAAATTLLAAAAIAALRFGVVSTVVPLLILVKGAVWCLAARRIRETPLPVLGLLETATALVFGVTVILAQRAG